MIRCRQIGIPVLDNAIQWEGSIRRRYCVVDVHARTEIHSVSAMVNISRRGVEGFIDKKEAVCLGILRLEKI